MPGRLSGGIFTPLNIHRWASLMRKVTFTYPPILVTVNLQKGNNYIVTARNGLSRIVRSYSRTFHTIFYRYLQVTATSKEKR